jgi:hypothetical protein
MHFTQEHGYDTAATAATNNTACIHIIINHLYVYLYAN